MNRMCNIEVCLDDNGDASGYYCKGHVDAVSFDESLRNNFGVTCSADDIKRRYYSFVPVHGRSYDFMMVEKPRRGRGCVAVTWVEADEVAILRQ